MTVVHKQVGPSDDLIIDLRSDAVTQPTDAMWEAMRKAPIGWASVGEDPSVNRLETFVAELTGKEAALYVPTGTMANLVGLMSYTQRGDQIILEASSHILWSEEWSLAYVCGVVPRLIHGVLGYMDPDRVRTAILDQRFSHRPCTRLICLENTHDAAGGTIISGPQIAAIAAVAREHDIPVHMDGARIFNACVALGKSIRELAADVDTLVLNLNKGLSAPEGALLCGSQAFIERSRVNLKRLGGHSMHKAGIYAAAGLVALQTMIPQLAEDNRRARSLAEGLTSLEKIRVDLETAQTNIVMAAIDASFMPATSLLDQMAKRGIKAYLYTPEVIRFVTHRHITDKDIDRVLREISDIIHH